MASGSVPCSASPSGPAVAANIDPNKDIGWPLINHLKEHNIGEHSFNVCWLGPGQDTNGRTSVACVTVCFEILKEMRARGVTCMQQLLYQATTGKIMEAALNATANAKKAAHRGYQEPPEAFNRYADVLEKDGEKEKWGGLIDQLVCFPFPQDGVQETVYDHLPNLIDPAKGPQSDRIRMALLTYGASDGDGHTFLVVWQGSLLFFIDSLSLSLEGAKQQAFMIVCRTPGDVKNYLDYKFRVKLQWPLQEPVGELKSKLYERAAKTKKPPYTKYQIDLYFFKLKALGPQENVKSPPSRKRVAAKPVEQQSGKAREAQPESSGEDPMLREELRKKNQVLENVAQQNNDLEVKLAEERKEREERVREAKEAEKKAQARAQTLSKKLLDAETRAKDQARELGDANKSLTSNRGLLKNKEVELKELKQKLEAAQRQRNENVGKGATDAGAAAASERQLAEVKRLRDEQDAKIKELQAWQDQRAREVEELKKEREELQKKLKNQSEKAKQATLTEKQAAETEANDRREAQLKVWQVQKELQDLRNQEKGWKAETDRLQQELEDAKTQAAKGEEDHQRRLGDFQKLVDELQNRAKEAERKGVAAEARETEGQRKKLEEEVLALEKKWTGKVAELQLECDTARENEGLAMEREMALEGQLRELKESRLADIDKAKREQEASLSKDVDQIVRFSEAKEKILEEKLAICQEELSSCRAELEKRAMLVAHQQEQAAAQKTVQAEEPEAAQLRLKLQSSEKDLQESQEDAARVRKELEETKHALEAARASSDAARVEQERLQAQLDAAAPESPAVGQAELAMALARVDDLADSPGEARGALQGNNPWELGDGNWPEIGEADVGHPEPEGEQVEGSVQTPNSAKATMKAVGTKRGRQEAEAPMKKKRARAGKVEGNGEKARKKKLTWEDFWAKETHLAKAAFDACHSKTHASLTVCGDPQCKKRSSYFCSGCQMAFCKYSGAKCWGKAHTNLYFDFLKTAEANAREKFKELKKKSK